jgi:hypothetical protein
VKLAFLALVASLTMATTSCGTLCQNKQSFACVVVNNVVDCTGEIVGQHVAEFLPAVAGLVSIITDAGLVVDWGALAAKAIVDGLQDVGCVFTAVIDYLKQRELMTTAPASQPTAAALRRLKAIQDLDAGWQKVRPRNPDTGVILQYKVKRADGTVVIL